MRFFSAITAVTGSIVGVTALTLIPISSYEGWRSDPVVPVMLVIALTLLFLSCWSLDRADAARDRKSHRSL